MKCERKTPLTLHLGAVKKETGKMSKPPSQSKIVRRKYLNRSSESYKS